MAIEYVSITPGAGKNIAVDTIGGNEFQIVKLGLGAEDALDNVVDAGQQTMAASVPVVVASDQDFVKAEDAAHSSGDKGIMALAVYKDTPASQAAEGDYHPLLTDAKGALWVRIEDTSYDGTAGRYRVSKRVAVTASQTAAVWTPQSDKRFVLRKLVYSATAAGTVQLYDQTDSGNTVITPIMSIAANGGFVMEWPTDWPYRSAAANNVLKYTSGAGAAGSIYVEGWEE